MQDEIRVLEKDLERLDYNDLTSPSEDAHDCLTSRDSDIMRAKEEGKPSKRESLLSIIRDKLVRYDEVLVKARELNAFQRPSTRDYKSLRHWFDIESPLSYAQEEEYVMKKEDLITLRQGREWAGFDGWVESSIKILPKRLRMVSWPYFRKTPVSSPECSGFSLRLNHVPKQKTSEYIICLHPELRGLSVSSLRSSYSHFWSCLSSPCTSSRMLAIVTRQLMLSAYWSFLHCYSLQPCQF
jgi:hypothetical protein